MYEVYIDGKSLYYPGDKVNAITSGVLKTKLNDSGTFNFSLPVTNPYVNWMRERISEISIRENGAEIWAGEVRQVKNNMKNEKSVCAVGELAYLGASSQPQAKYTNKEPIQVFAAVIAEHNRRVELRKRFHFGIVAVDNPNHIVTWATNYENTLDYLRTEMCGKLNAYLRVRKVNGIRYIDLVRLSDYGKPCNQAIEFGENLLDYTSDLTSDAIATVCRPLGAKIEVEGDEEKADFERYTTIESVNGGSDYIVNQTAVDSGIGMVWQTVEFKDITDPAELKKAGEDWLKDKQFSDLKTSVTAVDLSKLNADIHSLELGDSVQILATPFGMDKRSYITEKTIDLLNPTIKNNLSIGERVKMSYTQQASMVQGQLLKEMPKQQIILELAKENASQIIKSATEGNIYFVNNDDGTTKELLIMDSNNIETAKKVWRWNINGLGYSKTGYNGTFGLAMTMDGAIVADYITVGTLRSITINNGDGTFYVDENGNATMSNAEIIDGHLKVGDVFEVTKDKVKITGEIHAVEGGTIAGWKIFDRGLNHMSIDTDTQKKGVTIAPAGLVYYDGIHTYSQVIPWQTLIDKINSIQLEG